MKNNKKEKETVYIKDLTPFYVNNPDINNVVSFKQVKFDIKIIKDDNFSIEELENIDVFDPNRYLKKDLIKMTKKFIHDNDYLKF